MNIVFCDDEESILPSAVQQCPRGHALTAISAYCSGHCDACRVAVEEGGWVAECKACRPNWWICYTCEKRERDWSDREGDEEDNEEEKEYGIMDLGAINKRLAVESSKIQHLRRFTAEWEGDVEADFDSDSD